MARRRWPESDDERRSSSLGMLLRKQMMAQGEADRIARGEANPSVGCGNLFGDDPARAAADLLGRISEHYGYPVAVDEVPHLHRAFYASTQAAGD